MKLFLLFVESKLLEFFNSILSAYIFKSRQIKVQNKVQSCILGGNSLDLLCHMQNMLLRFDYIGTSHQEKRLRRLKKFIFQLANVPNSICRI